MTVVGPLPMRAVAQRVASAEVVVDGTTLPLVDVAEIVRELDGSMS